MVYVSITGLRLNGMIHAPRFWWHAIRSMLQAKSSPGNISAEARKVDGIHHTLTVWQSKDAMRSFLVTGAHLQAMKSFKSFASGKVLGFESDTAPTWEEALTRWLEQSREV